MADEKAPKPKQGEDVGERPAGQDAEPGTQEHLGSDRPYEGADPDDEK